MGMLQIGPVGGNGGKPFENYAIPEGARLTTIHVYTEWVINAIQLDFINSDGNPDGRPPIGGLGGEHHVFYLDEDEYLTGISGRAGWYVDSIRFHTNKRISQSYGGMGGDRDYTFEAPAGHEVCGFFGRSAWYIDSLGVSTRRHIKVDYDDSEDSYLIGNAAVSMADAVATKAATPEEITPHLSTVHGDGPRQPRPAELELVEGIGPKIAELLISNGINDLADLAVTPVDRVREILTGAGKRFRLADPGTWQDQAALGAAGKWDELSELQSRLKAGR